MGFGDSWHPSQPRDVVAMDGADARKKDKSKKAKGSFFLFVCGPKKELKLAKTRHSLFSPPSMSSPASSCEGGRALGSSCTR